MNDFSRFIEYLPILIPILIVDIILKIIAFVHIFKQDRYRVGNRWLWIAIVLLISTFGSIIYFLLGREDN